MTALLRTLSVGRSVCEVSRSAPDRRELRRDSELFADLREPAAD